MSTPNDRKYTKTHEWIKPDGTVGLSEFAVHAIKDVVYLELPPKGKVCDAGKPFGIIESVKAVFDLNAPLGGVVGEVNEAVAGDFSHLSQDPYGKGWLIKLSPAQGDAGGLMDAAAYDRFCADEQH